MKAPLQPDRYFSRISRIDVRRDLVGCGLTHVLLDVDNTVRARDSHAVPRDVGLWLGRARDAGVRFCLVSNNWHADTADLGRQLDMPVVGKACKPLPHGLVLGMRRMGGTREDTVVVGDQLWTDVAGANILGMTSYLVAPLVEQDLPHTVLLHRLDRLVLGSREPEGSPACAPSKLYTE